MVFFELRKNSVSQTWPKYNFIKNYKFREEYIEIIKFWLKFQVYFKALRKL